MNVDVLIVGAGPAGSSAALVLAQSRRAVLQCDDGKPRNAASGAIHGLLTHGGQSPADFKQAIEKALRPYETLTRLTERISSLTRHDGHFKFQTASGTEGSARKSFLTCVMSSHTFTVKRMDGRSSAASTPSRWRRLAKNRKTR